MNTIINYSTDGQCVCVCVCACVHMSVCMYLYICECMHLCLRVCACVSLCMCMYMWGWVVGGGWWSMCEQWKTIRGWATTGMINFLNICLKSCRHDKLPDRHSHSSATWHDQPWCNNSHWAKHSSGPLAAGWRQVMKTNWPSVLCSPVTWDGRPAARPHHVCGIQTGPGCRCWRMSQRSGATPGRGRWQVWLLYPGKDKRDRWW